MASSEQTATDRKHLKPVKTKLRLKKEDVRQCRLCMRVLPRADIRDTAATGSDLRSKILNAVSVKITSFDKVTSVCTNCIVMVDIINDFWMTCRKADTLHGTKLLLMHPGSWLSDENRLTLAACHRLTKRNRAEMDALFKCSGLDSGDIHWLTKGEEMLLEAMKDPAKKVKLKKEPAMNAELKKEPVINVEPQKEPPVMNSERVDVPITFQPNEEKAEVRTEEIIDSDPEMSEQCGRLLDAQVEEANRSMAAKKEASILANMHMCEMCGKLVQKIYAEQHRNMHEGHKPYECPEENCNKRFSSNLVLNKHVNNVHRKKIKRYECEMCHKSIQGRFFYQHHLETHQANNQRKVPCNVCGKTFYKNYIKDHMFLHTGEMPYKCEFCDREFAARNNWSVHRKKQHSDQLEDQE